MDNDGYGPTIFVIAARMCFSLKRYEKGAEMLQKAMNICRKAKGFASVALVKKLFWLPANLQLYENV